MRTIKKQIRNKLSTGFMRSKGNRILIGFLALICFISLLADLIATDQPWMIRYNGQTWFPAIVSLFDPHRIEIIPNNSDKGGNEKVQFDITDWKQVDASFVIWAPIPWSSGKPDVYNRDFVGPGEAQKIKSPQGQMTESRFIFRHHLGTDRLGNDLLSMLIHGCRISLKIGLLSAFLASLIGLFFGAIAGYYADDTLKITRLQGIGGIIGLGLGLFWAFETRASILNDAFQNGFALSIIEVCISLFILSICLFLGIRLPKLLNGSSWFSKSFTVPLDTIIQRFSEIFSTMPKILILLTLAAVFRDKSIGMVIAIIGLTSWTGVSRFTRSEILRIRGLSYVDAARTQGLRNNRILLTHVLPNAMGPVMIEIAFLISGSILAESSLSFLGIGVPDEISTWGSILSQGRQEFDAWWMVVFPGLAIFITIFLFNSLGEKIRNYNNA
jgi:peptide/nickel transport system permease protein